MKLVVCITSILVGTCLLAFNAQATIVEFVTSEGNIRVNLHDSSTPKTVENFLRYVTNDNYVDSVIHRAETDFVIQGGGYKYNNDGFNFSAIDTHEAIINEPIWSNVKGTIAMAKIAGNPHSATNQWFFNLTDNSSNLDLSNAGFSVFGQVDQDSIAVLDTIHALTRCANNIGNTPMVNYTSEQCTNGDVPGYENFVVIYRVDIIDATIETDNLLDKKSNTLIKQVVENNTDDNRKSGGGNLLWLLAIMLFGFKRYIE